MAKKKNKNKAMKRRVNKKKTKDLVGISYTQTDVKSFLEKFKEDVAKKRKEYQEYAQESRKKKKL